MKKILYILIFVMLLCSCGNHFLEVTPLNELSDMTFWKTESDATLALNGCYRYWESYLNIALFDGVSDNAYEKSNFGYMYLGNGTVTAATYPYNSWIDYIYPSSVTNGLPYESGKWFSYSRIRKYNSFLANIDNVPMDENTKAKYKAEVRFLRAYDYFWKVMLHGDVPLVTTLITAQEKLPRDPAATVKQFVLDELGEIASQLPEENCITSQGHVTRGAAYALRARLELYMGNYVDAMADAKKVIDMSCFELYPNYRTLFLEEAESSNKECILSLEYIKDLYPNPYNQMSLPRADGGWSALNAVKSIVDAYECANGKTIDDPTSGYDIDNPFKNRDPRLEMSICCPGQPWNGRIYNTLDQYLPDGTLNGDYNKLEAASRSGMNIKKWLDPKAEGLGNWPPNFGNNFMAIRLAEVYLTYAEAAVETGTNTDLALEYINRIRTRVGHIRATSLTRELVRRERRVELAFEGLRYFDIMRWDLGPQVMNGPLYGSRYGTIDAGGKVTWKGDGRVVNSDNYIVLETRNFNPVRKYLFPIPQAEIDANPQMTQNPGY